jgi:hypothetical protein
VPPQPNFLRSFNTLTRPNRRVFLLLDFYWKQTGSSKRAGRASLGRLGSGDIADIRAAYEHNKG